MGRNKIPKSDEQLEIESKMLLTKTINNRITNRIKDIQNNFINNNTVNIP
jgi:uncharacterized protein YjbK